MYEVHQLVSKPEGNFLFQVEGPFKDYVAAWRAAGIWREKYPEMIFVAGGMTPAIEDPKRRVDA
jgi:hypothetical protein